MKQEMSNKMKLSDEELMRRVARKDASAFEILSERYSKLIYSVALKTLGKPHDAEDLRQQILVLLWDKAGSWDARRGRLSTWLCSVTRNRAIDMIRSWRAQSGMLERYRSESEGRLAGRSPGSAPSVVSSGEQCKLARRALGCLRPQDRELLSLVYFGELTHAEIARRQGIPLGTVKARVSRALKQLRRIAHGHQFAELAPLAA